MLNRLFAEIPCLKGERILMRALVPADAEALRELTEDAAVYRYLPAGLFEKRYPDPLEVIRRLYDECLEESLILGIFRDGAFCGLEELYGYQESTRKISVGCRLVRRCWGEGIAPEALVLILEYLDRNTDIEIVTASTLPDNKASARVLKEKGFTLVAHAAPEDWGFGTDTPADKWIRRRKT